MLTPCLVKLFRLCLSTIFPSCWKYDYVHPVPKKDDHFNPSNCRPIALISCLSKAFETILNKKFLTHGIRKGRSTGDLLAFPTDSRSSSLNRFGETFAVALDISKAYDRVWHKALLSKLPSYGLYPPLCSFFTSFLSGPSIFAVADGQCSTSKPINSGVPQGAVLSPLSFYYSSMIFLPLTNYPIHTYADDTTLHYSTSFDRHPNLQELQISSMLQNA